MNYRSGQIIIAAALALAAINGWLPSAMADANNWEVGQAKPRDRNNKVVIPGNGTRSIMIEDPEINVASDADAPDGQALVFSGSQQKPALVSGGVFEPSTSASLKFKIKPASDQKGEGTVFLHPGGYDVRVASQGTELRLYVIYKEKTAPVMVKAPLLPEKWNNVEVRIEGSKATVKVDGYDAAETFPDAATMNSGRAYVRLGAADSGRPFKGSLAAITVNEPAE